MSTPVQSHSSKTAVLQQALCHNEGETKVLKEKGKRSPTSLDKTSSTMKNFQSSIPPLQDSFVQNFALVDAARRPSFEEKATTIFKMNCKLARSYLDIILRTELVKMTKDTFDLTLRNFLFAQFIKTTSKEDSSKYLTCFDQLKELKPEDGEGYKKILATLFTEANFAHIKLKLGEQTAKALRALLNLHPLMSVSLKDIVTEGLIEGHPVLFKMLAYSSYPSSSTSKMTIYEAFTHRFFQWIMEQNDLSQPLLNSLLAIWEDLKQGKAILPESWVAPRAPALIQQQLLEFQTIYKASPINLFKILDAEIIFAVINSNTSTVPQLNAGQLFNSYTVWAQFLDEIRKEQKQLMVDFRACQEIVLDLSFEKTQESARKSMGRGKILVVDKKKHRKHIQNTIFSDDERLFVRLCSHFEQTCARRVIAVSEEIDLLKKTPDQAELIKWSLFATIEPFLKIIGEIKKLSETLKEICEDKLRPFSLQFTPSKKPVNGMLPAGTKVKIGFKANPPLDREESIHLKEALTMWTKHHASMERFYFFTQKWTEMLQCDLEACFFAEKPAETALTPTDARDMKDFKEGLSHPKPVVKKIFTIQALRKRIAYETLHLPDLVDFNDKMFASPSAKPITKSSKKDQEKAPSPPSPTNALTAALTENAATEGAPAITFPPGVLVKPIETPLADVILAKQEALTKELGVNLHGFEEQIAALEKSAAKCSLIGAITPYSLTTGTDLK